MPRRNDRANRGRARPTHTWSDSLDGSLFCPCGKMSTRTADEAWSVATAIHRSRGGVPPERVYNDCPLADGAWHWTSKP